jgi:hypothetical protein
MSKEFRCIQDEGTYMPEFFRTKETYFNALSVNLI